MTGTTTRFLGPNAAMENRLAQALGETPFTIVFSTAGLFDAPGLIQIHTRAPLGEVPGFTLEPYTSTMTGATGYAYTVRDPDNP